MGSHTKSKRAPSESRRPGVGNRGGTRNCEAVDGQVPASPYIPKLLEMGFYSIPRVLQDSLRQHYFKRVKPNAGGLLKASVVCL